MPQKRTSKRAGGGMDGGDIQADRKLWRSRKLVYVLGILGAVGAGAWFGPLIRPGASHAISASKRAQRALQNHRNFDGHAGPWGLIEYNRIAISMPIEYAPGDPDSEPTRWWFQGASRERVEGLFAEAGLTPEQLRLLGQGGWEVSPQGVLVIPPRQLVIDLPPAARARIYNTLAADERNGLQHTPEIFYPQYLEERLESSGLSDQTLNLVRSLLYPRKSWTLFSDANVVLATLQTSHERQRFNQMVHRRMTVMAQLIIDHTSNVDAMVAYWEFRGRSKGLRSLFESLASVPGGGELDVSHVLTPFARKRLYSFPEPSDDPRIWRRDCGWTALNFFNDDPDDQLSNPEYAAKVLQRDYEQVTAPRFGDVAALVDENSESVHLASYVADGLMFTKNGFNRTQPWMLMKLEDLVAHYSINRPANLDVWYFRRKG
jgi:hypothetical protein